MSDDEQQDDEKPFAVERAKTGRAKCKKCKCPIDKDQVRIAKLQANPFGEGKMKCWHHVSCIFEVFGKQRATTKRIQNPEEDVSGWETLCNEDKDLILQKLSEFEDAEPFKGAKAKVKVAKGSPSKNSPSKRDSSQNTQRSSDKFQISPSTSGVKPSSQKVTTKTFCQDDKFLEFQRICTEVASCSSYLEKTAIVKKMFTKGSGKDGFKGDIVLWCRLLLPGVVKRVYNLQSKALIKLFSRLLSQNEIAMLEDLEKGDVAQTIKIFFDKSSFVKPCQTSELTLQEVDEFLDKLSTLTKEDEQTQHFKSILRRCTSEDLRMIIRLIKGDLRINAGAKHILGAVHDDAYEAFQVSRDLPAIINRCLSSKGKASGISSPTKNSKMANLSLMTPVLPMLAEACKSVDMAMQKCPKGMFSEVKYDGERLQVHKKGGEFRYFSRSLKPVLPHKVNFLKEYIPRAFPGGDDLILDAEILLIDTKSGQPLPFGSLGVHKKNEFKDANVCLFVFDIIFYNGESLLNRTIKYRRKLLEEKMTPIRNRIMLSETQEVHDSRKLAEMIANAFKLGLEGLVLKDVDSKYEPGKRHWLKVKKDYLFHGAMADSADLVVLGAWYGTGQKGGIMSVFLMGCHDPIQDVWLTVTKVHTGHDDATLTELQTSLDMVKIGKDPNLVPRWLKADKAMVPDFIAKDPKKQPVWEITGAEFTNQGVHTANGISIRFPRVTRVRDDKDWKTATNLQELQALFDKSADSIDYSMLLGSASTKRSAEDDIKSPQKRFKTSKKSPSKKGSPRKKSNDDPVNTDSENDSDEEVESNRQKKIQKKSPYKSKSYDSEGNANSDESMEEERVPEFYSFIGCDYIEYSREGSPLNWIEGRKPPKHLPKDARPIDQLDEDKKRSRCLVSGVSVYLDKDMEKDRRRIVGRTLKTLGATILPESDSSRATHVIHGRSRVPSTLLMEPSIIPRLARHVTESWVESIVKFCRVPRVQDHAVALSGVYCSCSCPHRQPKS